MNGSRHLPETLQSILAQAGADYDLLLCDDHSTDDTLECARRMAGDRIRLVSNPERLGLAGNWNQCVKLSRTPLIAIIHQDDVIDPGHLAAHLRAFESDPVVGLVASGSRVIDEAGREVAETVVERGGLGSLDRIFQPGEALPLMIPGNPLRCSAVSLRVAAHQDVGGFDPAFRYVVDWEFWLRVARRWSLAWLATPTVDVRWHEASETQRFKTGVIDLEETEQVLGAVIATLKDGSGSSDELKTSAFRRLSRAYLNRAHVALKGGDGRLGRDCLRRSIRLWPGIVGVLGTDVRLAAQMAAIWAAPDSAGRWFRRSN